MSINLPCESSASGLPIGLQLVGDFGTDGLLLDLAHQYQQAHPWAHRWPVEAD